MITDEDKERVRQATDFVTLVSETVELKPEVRTIGDAVLSTKKKALHSR